MLTTVFLPIFHQRQAVPSPFYMLHVCVHKLLKKRQKLYDNWPTIIKNLLWSTCMKNMLQMVDENRMTYMLKKTGEPKVVQSRNKIHFSF